MRVKLFVCTIVLCCLGSASAQDINCRHRDGKAADCNGISVGAPKVFDNRALTLMLETLNQNLKQQNNFIDQKTLINALANFQGLSTSEFNTNLSVTGPSTPTRDVSTEFKTGNVDANGNRIPNTFDRKTDTNQAGVTPQAPALDTLPGLPSGFSPTFGNSSSDLLNDQVNLTYQIFNLQMILDRSLSDRLKPGGFPGENGTSEDKNRTRLQGVLGFNVTIDPPRTANDAVAVVEITLKRKENKACPVPTGSAAVVDASECLSLVALMPQEKTYNAAALSTKSNAFSGAATVSAFQVGASARKRAQIFYVYRDTDTLSYERMTDDGNLVFGWMFRPVLGRRSVSPGFRQMFAVVALPNVDCTDADEENGSDCKAHLTTSVRTYWKKYDRGTMTSFTSGDANRAKKYWYALSLRQAYPQVFEHQGYENGVTYPDLAVYSTTKYQDMLQPEVDSVEWRQTGTKSVVVSAKGNNFFTNTQVSLGDKTYTNPTDGLILKSNQAFDITTTLDQLVNGPGAIIGRYGLAAPLVLSKSPPFVDPCGAEIISADTTHAISGIVTMTIDLIAKRCPDDGEPQKIDDLAKLSYDQANAAYSEAVHRVQEIREKSVSVNSVELGPLIAEAEKARIEAARRLDREKKISDWAHGYHSKKSSNAQFLETGFLPRSLSQGVKVWQTPIVSVNGSALDLPYDVYSSNGHVYIQVNLKESLLGDGGGLVKVTWPFYPTDKWTSSIRFYLPERGFQVARISEKSVIISRINKLAFVNDPARHLVSPEDGGDHCWRLIAGDTAIPLRTEACPCPPADKRRACEEKPQKATKVPTDSGGKDKPLDLGADLDYTVSATVDKMPSHAVLLAPNGTAYHLDIPDVTDKKDPGPKPLEMKQGDAAWISLTVPAGKTPIKVEANGKDTLKFRAAEKDDSKPADPKAPQTFNVEITREFTAKSGTLDLTVFDAKGKPIAGTKPQQIAITCSQCNEKGDK